MPLVLDHANLVVHDLAAQTAFYRDALGFRVILDRTLEGAWVELVTGLPGAVMDCVILEPPAGGTRLELLAYRAPAAVAVAGHELPQALGLRHLAFRVDDIEAVCERLRAAGAALVSEPVTVPFPVGGRRKRLVYFRDLEGVLLELAEYGAMEQVFEVKDMRCENCAATIRAALEKLSGVETVSIDVPSKRVVVTGSADAETVAGAIRGAGFGPEAG